MLRNIRFLFACAVFFIHSAAAQPVTDVLPDLVAKLSATVVNISSERWEEGAEIHSLGSGFVVDTSGLIITNHHVVEDGKQIFVNFADGSRRSAKVIGRDPKTDIALLQVFGQRKLAAVSFGNSDTARAGEPVFAIGNPFGFGGSVSAGIISARNRQLDAELYDDFIQTDAAINRGNSGGPLFNWKGEVIGVNSSLISPSGGSVGVSFAIPANTVKTVLAQLKRTGTVRRGWIGAKVLDLTPDLAAAFGLPRPEGALIGFVLPAGPAALAGLRAGDIVQKIDKEIVLDSRGMQRLVVEAPIGEMLRLSVLRKGVSQEILVRMAQRSDSSGVPIGLRHNGPPVDLGLLGLHVKELDAAVRVKAGIGAGVQGVLVRDVRELTPAAEASVRAGDVVLEVAQNPIASEQAFHQSVRRVAASGRRAVLLTVNRSGEILFKALRLPDQMQEKRLKVSTIQ